MSEFQYVARSQAQWEKRASQSGSNFVGIFQDWVEIFSYKKDNLIRMLPPTFANPQHYGMDVWVHYGVGPENGQIICLHKMGRGPCPICEFQSRAEAAGREDAADYKSRRRVLVWLKNWNAEDDKKLIAHAWAMPWTADRDLTAVCKDRMTGELYQIDHPTAGFEVSFQVTGEGQNVRYIGWQIGRRATTVEDTFLNQIMEHPLDKDVLMWRDYEEVKRIFEGNGSPAGQETPQATVGMVPAVAAPSTPAPVQVMPTAPPQAQVAVAPPPAPAPVAPPPPPPKQFVSEWTNTICEIPGCGKPQYTISPTEKTCENAHRMPFNVAPQPVVVVSPPPAQPGNGEAKAPQSASAGRAAELKRQFMTGGGK